MWQVRDPLTALALGVAVGAPAALVPHAAKTVLRAASTTLTGGLANPLISVAEDVLAVAMFVFTVVLPVLAATALAVVAYLVLRRLSRRSSAPSLRTT
jgi:predicted PurR-regulated permease PerM